MSDSAALVRVVVVDDEPLARERLLRLLHAEPDMSVVATCGDGDAAVQAVATASPDLLFLDVQMPGRDGFQVVEALLRALPPARMPVVVFVTAYDAHALRAFEAQALDYLVKPFDDDRFAASLARVRRTIRQARMESIGDQLRQLLDRRPVPGDDEPAGGAETAAPEQGSGRLERLVLRTGDRSRVLRAESIDWIGADSVYARIHFGRASSLIRTPMHELETRLDPRRFVRIHRSTIVNVERVRELHEERGECVVVLDDGTRLKVSRNRRAQLQAMLGQAF